MFSHFSVSFSSFVTASDNKSNASYVESLGHSMNDIMAVPDHENNPSQRSPPLSPWSTTASPMHSRANSSAPSEMPELQKHLHRIRIATRIPARRFVPLVTVNDLTTESSVRYKFDFLSVLVFSSVFSIFHSFYSSFLPSFPPFLT